MSAFFIRVETLAPPRPLLSAIEEPCSLSTRLGISIQTKLYGYAVLVVPNDDAEKMYFVLSSAMELKSTISLFTSSHAEMFKNYYDRKKNWRFEMTPYLIQRGKIRREPSRKGLDGFVAFDYMGSSEFEFGALSKSLKVIRAEIKFYQHQIIYFPNAGPVLIFAKDVTETLDLIKNIGRNHFRLKEHCDFFDWCNPSAPLVLKKEHRNNFWWDIENYFMFWLSQPNDQLILKAIQGEVTQ